MSMKKKTISFAFKGAHFMLCFSWFLVLVGEKKSVMGERAEGYLMAWLLVGMNGEYCHVCLWRQP